MKSVIEALTTFANPAELTGRNTNHQRIILDILGDDGTRAYKGTLADGVTTDNGTVGTKRGAFTDERLGIDAMNRKVSARGCDVGENTGGATKNIILYFYAFIDRDIVLNADSIADADIVANINILAQRAVSADMGSFLYVAEMPDLCAFAYLDVVVDVARRMNIIIHS